MLRIKLFGTGQAHYFDRALNKFPYLQCHLLLCYLLLNRPTTFNRDQLAVVFWNEHPSYIARKNLRNVYWRLRCTLEDVGVPADDYLLSDNEHITFNWLSSYWLDVEIFENTLDFYRGVSGKQFTSEQATELEEAINLYTGDLLQDNYEDWCLHDRERLRLLYLKGLDKLMVFHETNGAYERALAYGERILALDQIREKVHQRMMWLYWLSGNRSAALRQYKQCVQILRKELDQPPTDEIVRLNQRIIANQVDQVRGIGSSNQVWAAKTAADDPNYVSISQAFQKIEQLKTTIYKIHDELHQLEALLSGLSSDQND